MTLITNTPYSDLMNKQVRDQIEAGQRRDAQQMYLSGAPPDPGISRCKKHKWNYFTHAPEGCPRCWEERMQPAPKAEGFTPRAVKEMVKFMRQQKVSSFRIEGVCTVEFSGLAFQPPAPAVVPMRSGTDDDDLDAKNRRRGSLYGP